MRAGGWAGGRREPSASGRQSLRLVEPAEGLWLCTDCTRRAPLGRVGRVTTRRVAPPMVKRAHDVERNKRKSCGDFPPRSLELQPNHPARAGCASYKS